MSFVLNEEKKIIRSVACVSEVEGFKNQDEISSEFKIIFAKRDEVS